MTLPRYTEVCFTSFLSGGFTTGKETCKMHLCVLPHQRRFRKKHSLVSNPKGLRSVCRFSLKYLWKREVRITKKPYTPQKIVCVVGKPRNICWFRGKPYDNFRIYPQSVNWRNCWIGPSFWVFKTWEHCNDTCSLDSNNNEATWLCMTDILKSLTN